MSKFKYNFRYARIGRKCVEREPCGHCTVVISKFLGLILFIVRKILPQKIQSKQLLSDRVYSIDSKCEIGSEHTGHLNGQEAWKRSDQISF